MNLDRPIVEAKVARFVVGKREKRGTVVCMREEIIEPWVRAGGAG